MALAADGENRDTCDREETRSRKRSVAAPGCNNDRIASD